MLALRADEDRYPLVHDVVWVALVAMVTSWQSCAEDVGLKESSLRAVLAVHANGVGVAPQFCEATWVATMSVK